jgi:hypothetical protein
MIKFCLETPNDFEKMKLYKHIQLTKNENHEIFITKNIMNRLMNNKTYFFTENFFKINFIEFNNLKNYNPIDINIECLFEKKTQIGEIKTEKIKYLYESKYCQNREENNNTFFKRIKKKIFNIFFKGVFNELEKKNDLAKNTNTNKNKNKNTNIIQENDIDNEILNDNNNKNLYNNKLLPSDSSSFNNKENKAELDLNGNFNLNLNLNNDNDINEKENKTSSVKYYDIDSDDKEKHLRMVIIYFNFSVFFFVFSRKSYLLIIVTLELTLI